MKQDIMSQEVEIPEKVEVKVEGSIFKVKGAKGENSRSFEDPKLNLEVKDNKVIISAKNATKREKTMIGTFKSHVNNMMKGINEGFLYKLKICSGHFPMNVTATKEEIIVKNFLGESVPRKIKIKTEATVKIEGDLITVESFDKEIAGQTAANIEQLTRISNRDRRIFQDGIWIIEKCGKEV